MEEAQISRYAHPMKQVVHALAWFYLLSLLILVCSGLVSEWMLDRFLGWGALFFLIFSLACTPVYIVFNFPPLRRLRRITGIYAFVLASLHMIMLFVINYGLNWNAINNNLRSQWPWWLGAIAWLIMLVLTITSFKWWRRLLHRNWKRLHRLVYGVGGIICLHIWGAPQAGFVFPLLVSAFMIVLLALRLPAVKRQ
ncbi:MAG: ferric reductase-like transmembrane domain-containing protein, partial [Anaerolineae bacterium]|nr:ferric reductase-like transmembrane domain-containing protein [Anaerolineae bacterium]